MLAESYLLYKTTKRTWTENQEKAGAKQGTKQIVRGNGPPRPPLESPLKVWLCVALSLYLSGQDGKQFGFFSLISSASFMEA